METAKIAVLSVGENEEHSYPLCCCLPAMLQLCCKKPSEGDCLAFPVILNYPLLSIYHQCVSFKLVDFLQWLKSNYFWHFIFAEKLCQDSGMSWASQKKRGMLLLFLDKVFPTEATAWRYMDQLAGDSLVVVTCFLTHQGIPILVYISFI